MIKVICFTCTKEFYKKNYEYKKSELLGRRHFCSRRCSGLSRDNVERIKAHSTMLAQRNIKSYSGNKRDKYTGFRGFLKRAIKRSYSSNGKLVCSIQLDDLVNQWEAQNGICPYSGVKLILPDYDVVNDKIYTASLDRVDSNKGYEVGNIQFVSIAVNYAKNNMTHDEMLVFCEVMRQSGRSAIGVVTRLESD